MQTHHVELRSYRMVGWLCLATFTAAAIGSFASGYRWSSLYFLLFVLLGLYIRLGAGGFDFDSERLVHRSGFGEWQIRWDEITAVEVGVAGTFVFRSGTKAFVLSPPGWWPVEGRKEALSFLLDQIVSRGLNPTVSRKAEFAIMRHTRVPRALDR
jgi:hypothetical protein